MTITPQKKVSIHAIMTAGIFVLYVSAFPFLHGLMGTGTTAFSLIPVIASAWYFGIAGGLVTTLAAMVINLYQVTTLTQIELGTLMHTGGAAGVASLVMASLLVGRMRNLTNESRREIKRRTQVESELTFSREKYRLLFEAIQEGFLLFEIRCDEDQRPQSLQALEANLAFEQLTGVTREMIHRQPSLELMKTLGGIKPEQIERAVCSGEVTRLDGYSAITQKHYQVTIIRPKSELLAMVFHDISERKANEAQLRFLATHDPLTRLPNRSVVGSHIDQAILAAKLSGRFAAVLFIDLDNFKTANDEFGHAVGDQVLQIAGERFANSLRQTDMVARMGGDEFVIVLDNLPGTQVLENIIQKIYDAQSAPITIQEKEFRLEMSLGIAVYPLDGITAEALLRNADQAMYEAKVTGKNRYVYFSAGIDLGQTDPRSD